MTRTHGEVIRFLFQIEVYEVDSNAQPTRRGDEPHLGVVVRVVRGVVHGRDIDGRISHQMNMLRVYEKKK